MGLLSLVEDRPTPRAVYNWRVYMCATVASMAACMIGYDSAFIGTTLALPSFVTEFEFARLSTTQRANISANIVSVYQAGAFFGALSAYIFAYYLGRKKSLYVYAAVFQLGSGIMLAASRERGLGPIYGGRVLAGLGVGGASMLVPVYISELSPPAIRGRLVGIYELGWQIGGLVGFWIVYGVSLTMAPGTPQWHVPFAVQLIPGGLLLIGTFFLKESPRWLLTKNRREEALKNLCWIRKLNADDLYIVEEVGLIDAAITADTSRIGSGFWAPFKAAGRDKKVLYRLFLGGMLFLWQNGSGINAVNYYSPTVFRSLGITGTNTGFLTTGLFGVVKTTLTFVWLLYLIDHLGRRQLLMIGAAGGSFCMWIIGAYVYRANPNARATGAGASLTPGGIAAIFFFYLWTAFYTPSWNGTPWVLNSEMFDSATRSLGQASASASNWLWNFVISRATPTMFLRMGRSGCGVYFFFATMMIVSIFFVFFLIPETKSVPLEYMDRLFEVKPIWNANKIVIAEAQARDAEFRHDADGADLSVAKEKLEKMERTSDV
ncbi:hypothetical protein CAC42_6621 [Sphaceloma murrayae]|uniref:Quinate transporter n=1 Tax=Sphaceloma murrayae TaxID=2082308 RepID=A0A2K1QFZ2_9PEZI|nr:hypothetical protein CAC42_6621 [Sphaceloma murrayae]